VYFASGPADGHRGLRYVDLYNNSTVDLGATLGHAVEHFDVATDNRTIAISWTEFGYSRIALLDRITNGVSVLPSLPPGAVNALRFDHDGRRLAVELAASTAPSDVYVCELGTKACSRWTESKLAPYAAARLIAPLTVRFPTWDRPGGSGSALTALLYRPRTPGPYPVLIMLNGGGVAPSAKLEPFVQYCVNELKVAVVAPSLRDGEAGVVDLGALLAWLGAQPDLRRDRIMMQGRGAGGTLALAGLGLYGDRLRAAVSVDGTASSSQVMPIRKPVLLVRGLSSPSLDAASAEQLLWRLRSAKIDSWFVAPRDRRATLSSESEQLGAQSVMAQFIARQLGG
jgi:dipeptidyl aminopeptidase/acylaminoacyl peptidase